MGEKGLEFIKTSDNSTEGQINNAILELMELLGNVDADLVNIESGADHMQELLDNYPDKKDIFFLGIKSQAENLIRQARERVESRRES